MSNLSCASGDQTSVSSGGNVKAEINQPPLKRKRNLPGNPDPDAEVIALSPATLMARNRFVCEICNKGFQRDQNLQLHRRGHNLPWKLKQRTNKDVIRKKVYVCPETSCVHHEASRALGDLTGIKKHFSRKHGEKKWKCERCTKRYAVQSDWKAHSKTCGTREYRCDCGTIFSRRDSFITHRAFCDALTEESGKTSNAPAAAAANGTSSNNNNTNNHQQHSSVQPHVFNNLTQHHLHAFSMKKEQQQHQQIPQWLAPPPPVGLQDPQSRATPIIHMQHQQFTDHHSSSPYHQDLTQPITSLHNSNPNPSYSGFGPTGCAPSYIINSAHDHDQYVTAADITSPHMSATALLQKAALMGAAMISTKTSSSSLPSMTMTLTRPHQADQVQEEVLSPSKNKDSCLTWEQKSHAATTTGASSHPIPPSNPFHQNHMDIDHESTTFEEFDDGFLEEDVQDDDHDRRPCASVGIANDHNGMTRDFLGLRPQLSNTHILNIAHLQHNTTSNSNDHDHELI